MSYGSFIPQFWAAELLSRLAERHVYCQPGIVNRNYEGEIRRMGDTVRINAVSDVTVGDYVQGTDITPETLNTTSTTMVIDKQKYYFFAVDDIDRVQMAGDVMSEGIMRAAYQLSYAQDTWASALMVAGCAANNVIANSVPTSSTAYEKLVDLEVLLQENNVPGPYWVIVPPWFHGLLRKDDRFVKYGTEPQTSVLRNGVIGEAAGMTVLRSNNVPNTAGASYKIIAGSSIATTVADQLVETEALRLEKQFADAVRGLQVYGGKVVYPEALAVLTVSKS